MFHQFVIEQIKIVADRLSCYRYIIFTFDVLLLSKRNVQV